MSNVVNLPCWTTLDLPVEKVLNGALKNEYVEVIVIGVEEDGTLQLHSSRANLTVVFANLHSTALKILQGDYGRLSNGEG